MLLCLLLRWLLNKLWELFMDYVVWPRVVYISQILM